MAITPWQQGLEAASIERIDQLAIDTRAALHKLRSAWVGVANLLSKAQLEMSPEAFASWYQQELGLNKQKVSEFVAAKLVLDYAPGTFNETNSSTRALRLLKATDDTALLDRAVDHVRQGHKLTRTWVEQQTQAVKEEAKRKRLQYEAWGYVEHPETGEWVHPSEVPGYVVPGSTGNGTRAEKLTKAEELLEEARRRKEAAERRWNEVKPVEVIPAPEPITPTTVTSAVVPPVVSKCSVAPGDRPAMVQTVDVESHSDLDDALARIAELETQVASQQRTIEGLHMELDVQRDLTANYANQISKLMGRNTDLDAALDRSNELLVEAADELGKKAAIRAENAELRDQLAAMEAALNAVPTEAKGTAANEMLAKALVRKEAADAKWAEVKDADAKSSGGLGDD